MSCALPKRPWRKKSAWMGFVELEVEPEVGWE
jgi:hypothetical protein